MKMSGASLEKSCDLPHKQILYLICASFCQWKCCVQRVQLCGHALFLFRFVIFSIQCFLPSKGPVLVPSCSENSLKHINIKHRCRWRLLVVFVLQSCCFYSFFRLILKCSRHPFSLCVCGLCLLNTVITLMNCNSKTWASRKKKNPKIVVVVRDGRLRSLAVLLCCPSSFCPKFCPTSWLPNGATSDLFWRLQWSQASAAAAFGSACENIQVFIVNRYYCSGEVILARTFSLSKDFPRSSQLKRTIL